MAIKHTIRANGFRETKEVNLTPMKVIRLMCTECMGFQVYEIKDCTDMYCPAFPYREGKNLSRSGATKRKLVKPTLNLRNRL
jgi:hypothetical protein